MQQNYHSNQHQQSLQHSGQASSKESSSQQSPSKLSEYIGLPKALGVQSYVKSVYGWFTGGPSTPNQLPQSSSTANVIPPTENYYKLAVHPSQTNNKEAQNLISINKAVTADGEPLSRKSSSESSNNTTDTPFSDLQQQPAQTPHVKAALENSTADVHTAREATKNPFQYPKSEFTLNGNGNFWIPTDVIDIDVWYEKKKQICDMITETSYLNSGAYGSISTCKIKLLKQKFVCKTLKFIKLVDDKPFEILGQIEGIKAELKVLSEIDSQYIPKLFYAGFDEDCFYIIVTEFISGGTLACHRLNIHQKDVSFIGMELARGIQCLHDRNLSHGDLTPSNVALTPDGHVVLIDFGNSRDISKPLILPRCHESFVAPEVAKGLPANSAADWWSFGCILVYLLQTDEPINIKKKTGISLADDLISKLLVDNPNERLVKVFEHPFLQAKNPTFKPGELLIASESKPSEEIDKCVFLPLGQDDPLGAVYDDMLSRFCIFWYQNYVYCTTLKKRCTFLAMATAASAATMKPMECCCCCSCCCGCCNGY
uniref:non-specific serine/threonine protein kinase n=1 Tax=Panagrolaimus davidi TaxID=227884 RepID=A0A914PX74_9BILA